MRCWKNNLILDILKHKLSTVRSHLSSGQTHTDKWTGNDLAQTSFNVLIFENYFIIILNDFMSHICIWANIPCMRKG